MADPRQRDRDMRRIAAAASRLGMDHPQVVPLTGGSRNRCFRLSQGARTAVLRIAGAFDAQFAVERRAEARAQQLAAAHGLAPSLLYEDAAAGILLMEYAAGPVWDRAKAASVEGATRAASWLAALHRVPPPADLRKVDFVASLDDYCRQLADDPQAGRLLAQLDARRRAVAGGTPHAFCHNDLHHLNLVESAAGLWALDWEYAGVGDPTLDLAGYIAYHDLGHAAHATLLDTYHAEPGAPPTGDIEHARWLFEAVWWAWLQLKQRLEGNESAETACTRQRLADRLGLG